MRQDLPSLSIRLLGTFEVRQLGSEPPIELRRKSCAILAFLAATRQPHLRQELVDLFCQDVDDPWGTLRSTLSRLRQRIGAGALLVEGNTVQFNQDIGWVDCLAFEAVLERDLDSIPMEVLAQTIDLYKGEFLHTISADRYPEFEFWLLNQRAHFQTLFERGQEALLARLIERGDIETAIPRAYALVQNNPLMEEAHARLIWLYAKSGQLEAALEQYERCCAYLARELAVEPSPELQMLREEIIAGRIHGTLRLSTSVAAGVMERSAPSDFVGRTSEMVVLRRNWEAARAGHPAVVLLDGQAGMGKTRLVHEFARSLPDAEFLVGECYESSQALAYSPWLEVLDARMERVESVKLTQLSEYSRYDLARLMPRFARRLNTGARPSLPAPENDTNRLFAAIAEFLLGPARSSSLLLFIDNLQWADQASLQLFLYLARYRTAQRVLLIGAIRPEELEDTPGLMALIRDMERQHCTRLSIAPLILGDIIVMTGQLWPDLPSGDRHSVAEMLLQSTGGNPFFLSEVLRVLSHATSVPPSLPVPQTVIQLIRQRLELLPDNARQVIEALAVLEMPATLAQAKQTSGRSESETSAAVDLALRRRLLTFQEQPRPARYDFEHDLIREAVTGQLSPIRAQALHRRAAMTLKRAGAPAATLAYHWHKAGNPAQEAHYAGLAGRQAMEIYANDEALRYFERALELIESKPRRLELIFSKGEVLQLLARNPEAETCYEQGLALSEAINDRQAQAQCLVALGRLTRIRSDYSGALDRLEKALAIFQDLGNREGQSKALWGLGGVYWSQLDYTNALRCFEAQFQMAQGMGSQRLIASALGSMAVVYTEQGDYARALDCYIQKIQLDVQFNDRLSLAKTIGNMGIVYADLGAYEHALACYRWLLQVTLELGDRQNVCVALGNMISVYADLEQWKTAERLSDQALTLCRALNLPLYLTEYLYTSADLFARQKKVAKAASLNGEAMQLAERIGRTDILLPARLLSTRLQLWMNQVDAHTALQELEDLLAVWPEEVQQAAILYERWQIEPSREADRQKAAVFYQKAYIQSPRVLYRQRYTRLVHHEIPPGELPPSPVLTNPPEMVMKSATPLETLLNQVDQLLSTMNR